MAKRNGVLRLFPAAALALLLAPPLFSETMTLPAVTSLPVGAAASPFFSDVRVFNTSYTASVSVTAVYRCFIPQACTAAGRSITFVLGPRESQAFDNMIFERFNAPSTAGAVEFTSSGDSVRVTSRLYSPFGAGTNGMFVPGMKASQAHGVSVLTGLSNGLFRTNVGVYNGNDVGVNVTIKLFNGTALLGTQAVQLGPRSGTQVNRIFDAVGQGGLVTTNAFAVVESGSSAVPLFTYAAIIDNATADSSFVSGEEDVPSPAGPGPTPQTVNVNLTNYAFSPGTTQPVQVTAGASTTLVFEATQGVHGFSGVPAIGLNGSNNISAEVEGDPYYGGGHPAVVYRVTFIAPTSARGSTFDFWCTTHPTIMRGTLRVN